MPELVSDVLITHNYRFNLWGIRLTTNRLFSLIGGQIIV